MLDISGCGRAQVVVLSEPGDDVPCELRTFSAKHAVKIIMESYDALRFDFTDD